MKSMTQYLTVILAKDGCCRLVVKANSSKIASDTLDLAYCFHSLVCIGQYFDILRVIYCNFCTNFTSV